MKIRTIVVPALIASTVGVLALGAWSQRDLVTELTTHVKTAQFATHADLVHERESTNLPPISLKPRQWMPNDSTDITISFTTTDQAGWNARMTSATGLTPDILTGAGCTAVADAPKPALDSDFLPASLPTQAYHCTSDGNYVAQSGHTVYAWQAPFAQS